MLDDYDSMYDCVLLCAIMLFKIRQTLSIKHILLKLILHNPNQWTILVIAFSLISQVHV